MAIPSKEVWLDYRLQGELGVQKAVFEFLKLNLNVYKPFVDKGVDLLIEYNGQYLKIHCKTSKFTPKSENCVVYELTKTYHSNSKIGVKKYTPEEVDYFFLFSELHEDKPCLVPFVLARDKRTINIDYSSSKSHPLKNHYKDFEVKEILSNLRV